MSRSECIRRAKETVASRHAESVAVWEQRIREVSAEIPEFASVDRQLQLTGPKIIAASVGSDGGTAGEEAVSAIRAEYDALAKRRRQILTEHGYPADWCDMHYFCPLCSDSGYVGIGICSCLKKEIENNYLENSGLYTLTKKQTFETFSLDYYEKDDKIRMKRNAEILERFADSFVPGQSESFLFLGATGLGKTHLSSAAARAVIGKGYYVVYESAVNLFSAYEARRFGQSGSSGGEDADDTDRFLDCDLLIIDDLGAEITNKFTLSCLYNLLNMRMIRHSSVIISTNLNRAELRERYTDRIASRLFGEFSPLLFTGHDVREQKLRRTYANQN